MKRALWPLVLVWLAACSSKLAPESFVTGFRVLGLTADSPEIHPGDTTALHALVVDPVAPNKPNSLVWLSCDPDPLNLDRSYCSELDQLENALSLIANPDGGAPIIPPGMKSSGFDKIASYTAPAGVFSQLSATDPERTRGTIAQVLLIAFEAPFSLGSTGAEQAALFKQLEDGTVPFMAVLYRLVISEENPLNQNPVLNGLIVNGHPMADGGALPILPNATVSLDLAIPPSSFEPYVQLEADGTQLAKQESIIGSYYVSAGFLKNDRIALDSGTPQTFTAPDGGVETPIPPDRAAWIWVVLRDTRGGQSWSTFPVYLCDPSMPAPNVTAFSPTSGSGGNAVQLSFPGTQLDSILEVDVGGTALRNTGVSPSVQAFQGFLPPLPPGSYPVVVRGKDCHDYPLAVPYVAQ